MPSALMSNGSRILTPAEAEAMRAVISKPSNRSLYDFMVYTGLRLSEVHQLVDAPGVFDPDRRTITIRSGKVKATQRARNVILCDRGFLAVQRFLDQPRAPTSPSAWQQNLIRWAHKARLVPVPGADPTSYNPCALTVRTTRKSLESWLLLSYPERATMIALSQGHSEISALRHYLNLSFTAAERLSIGAEVAGWLR